MKILLVSLIIGMFGVYIIGEFAKSVDKMTDSYTESIERRINKRTRR